MTLESDGICRGIDLAGLADVELLHDERAPTVAAAPATEGPGVAPDQAIVALFATHTVRSRPNVHCKLLAFVAARRPITGERTVLPVLAQTIDNHGRAWLRVRLPGRPLGGNPPPRTGRISASNTVISTTAWHVGTAISHGCIRLAHSAITWLAARISPGVPVTIT